MNVVEEALRQAAEHCTEQFTFAPASALEFSDAVNAACSENLCGMYGKHWTCPPGVGTVRENREKYSRFQSAFVFTTVHAVASYGDVAAVDASREKHRQAEALLEQALAGVPHAVLGAGACNVCKKCTYPDAPCRFPDRAQTAVEAVGVDVLQLAQKLSLRSYNGAGTLTWFSVFLY